MIPEVKRERMRRSYHLEKKSLRQEEQQNLNWGKRMTNDPFFDQPYSDRQLILFVDDIDVTNKEVRRSCIGYFVHPFGKSRCKKDRVCLH